MFFRDKSAGIYLQRSVYVVVCDRAYNYIVFLTEVNSVSVVRNEIEPLFVRRKEFFYSDIFVVAFTIEFVYAYRCRSAFSFRNFFGKVYRLFVISRRIKSVSEIEKPVLHCEFRFFHRYVATVI